MTDTVSIRDLRVATVIGVYDWEREIEQTLVFSVDMAADVAKAAASDELADALDYSQVAATVAAVVRDGKFRLIETAAQRVAERVLAGYPVTWVRVEVVKPLRTEGYVSAVTIERGHRLPNLPPRRDICCFAHECALAARGRQWRCGGCLSPLLGRVLSR